MKKIATPAICNNHVIICYKMFWNSLGLNIAFKVFIPKCDVVTIL